MSIIGSDLPDYGYGSDYPSHLIDPKKKNKKWVIDYMKAMYARNRYRDGSFGATRKTDWMEARKYGQGNQSVAKYNKWASRLTDNAGNTVSYMDLNWKIVSPIPKFRDVLKGYFSKLSYAPAVNAINPEAADEKRKAKSQVWAAQQQQDFWEKLEALAGQKFGSNPIIPMVPESKEELELWFTLSYRLQCEMAMEFLINQVLNENDWTEIGTLLWDDFIDIGCVATCEYVDRIGKKIKVRYCDPVNMILEDFRGHDGSVMERIGEFRLMTISQIKLDAGNEFTEEEYWKMSKENCGRYGNAETLSPYSDYVNTDANVIFSPPWDNFQVLVLEAYYDSSDRTKWERKQVHGIPLTFEKGFDTKLGKKAVYDEGGQMLYEKEVIACDTKTTYGGMWVVGTDFGWNCGKVNDVSRTEENKRETIKPMKFYRVAAQGLTERMIPFADSIQLSWLKIQNLKARAIPKGIMIEIGAFENLAIDGKTLSSREALEIAIQSGIILYRRNSTFDEDGETNNGKPIEETKGGLGAEFLELRNALIDDIMMCREVSGISELFDASQQDPKQLVGTAKLAVAGTQNAIAPIINGFVWMFEKTCVDILLKLRLMARFNSLNLTGYIDSVGANAVNVMQLCKEISATNYGMKIEALPTEQERGRIMQVAQEALASVNDPIKGGIDFDDYLKIGRWVSDGKTKLAEAYLGYKIRKFKEYLAKQSQDNIAQQGQQNAMVAKTTEEEKRKSLQFEADLEKMLDDNKSKNKREEMKLAASLGIGVHAAETRHDIVREKQAQELSILSAT